MYQRRNKEKKIKYAVVVIFVFNKYFKIQNFNFLQRFESKSNNLQVIPIFFFFLLFSFICKMRNLKKISR